MICLRGGVSRLGRMLRGRIGEPWVVPQPQSIISWDWVIDKLARTLISFLFSKRGSCGGVHCIYHQ